MIRTGSIAVGTLALISSLASAAAPSESLRAWAEKSQARMAYSIRIGGQKVGWIVEETRLGVHAGKPVFESISEDFMETLFDGEKNVKSERSRTCYELTGEGAIVHHESKRTEDGKQTRRTAERVGNRLRIATEVGTRRVIREVPLPRDTLAHARALEAWLAGPRQSGDRFTKFAVTWDANNVNNPQGYLFHERKKVLILGRPLDVLRVQITIEGGKMESQVLPDARTVTADVGKFLNIRLDKEELAKKHSTRPVELSDLTSVLIDKPLGRARQVSLLKLQLTGLDGFTVPASHRQLFTPGKKTSLIELHRDFRVETPRDLSKEERKAFLATTPRLQIDQEPVRGLARKVTGRETDALAKAKLVEKWVFGTLKKSYSANADSALEILDNKAGDCTEHALLFVALCRAAGVPAREVGGLVYVGGKKPAFGWHAWAEVHDGRQWVSVDPTWDQVFVDGTHLKMSEGVRDMAWTNVLGTLKMKVVEVKSAE